ncbi:hypothetical protein J3R83DRAFT_13340 [Lanmaoa asiatica]|nr:hypothetical protein J3R83DRAFT_13340 [Lanmaoa asiatica]
MRRGSLETLPSPPDPDPSSQTNPSSPSHQTQDSASDDKAAAAVEDASNAGNHVVTTRSTEGEAELPSIDGDNKYSPPSSDGIHIFIRFYNSAEPEPSSKDAKEKDKKEVVDAEDIDMDVSSSDPSNAETYVVATRSTEGEAGLPSINDDNKYNTPEPPSKDPKEKEEVVDTKDHNMDVSSSDVPYVTHLPSRAIIIISFLLAWGYVSSLLRRPIFPQRSGWGRDPDEDFFHTVPPSHGGPHKKRAVFRPWPRDPNGKVLTPSEHPRGTLSPDGYPWGATLYDFFNVNRMPENPCTTTIMSGSAISEAMKRLGELDVAGPEMEWAKAEGSPRLEGVANTEFLIRWIETKVRPGVYNNYSMLDEVHDEDAETPEDENDDETEDKNEIECTDDDDDMEVDPASIPPPPTIPVTSPFHPSHYPKPWPFIPFKGLLSVLLQERIALCLLPKTLYVHDPFNLLSARERKFRDTSWKSRPDIIRTYNLKFSESVYKEVKETRRKVEELEETMARTRIILRYQRTKEQIENHEPVIEAPLPPYPRRTTNVEESHLYLSPVAKVGRGHHSIVYKGEWELPRDLFVRPKLCRQCLKESVDKEIQRLKDTGRWEEMLRAAAEGPPGFTGRPPTEAEPDKASNPIHPDGDGEIIEREITCVVPHNMTLSQIFEIIERGSVHDFMKRSNMNALHLNFSENKDESDSTKGSHVPTIRIDPPFSYENQKTCTHGSRISGIPRTAKFTVVAKLSFENDRHIVREASNYLKFPEDFFHHYNGYTFIDQLHAVVPVNAIVPQFYGYYAPKKDKREDQEQEPYLSPILLLEYCGEPIDPETLSVEDQEECASLLLRFQRAGWLHESVAPRNFLVQHQKPTELPAPFARQRKDPEPSFRLIDFGRSRRIDGTGEKRAEEMEALRMFKKLEGTMDVTQIPVPKPVPPVYIPPVGYRFTRVTIPDN